MTTTARTGTNFGANLYVAKTGTATLQVEAGGYATDFSGFIGYDAASVGTATVSSGMRAWLTCETTSQQRRDCAGRKCFTSPRLTRSLDEPPTLFTRWRLPDGVHAGRQRIASDEQPLRRIDEVQQQGRAEPVFHWLAQDFALVPVTAAGLAANPMPLYIVAVERLIGERQQEALCGFRDPLVFDDTRDHLARALDEGFFLEARPLVVKDPAIGARVEVGVQC